MLIAAHCFCYLISAVDGKMRNLSSIKSRPTASRVRARFPKLETVSITGNELQPDPFSAASEIRKSMRRWSFDLGDGSSSALGNVCVMTWLIDAILDNHQDQAHVYLLGYTITPASHSTSHLLESTYLIDFCCSIYQVYAVLDWKEEPCSMSTLMSISRYFEVGFCLTVCSSSIM